MFDQALGVALLKLVKNGQMRLGGFSLSLLLSLARIRRFEESTIACVVGLVRGAMQLRARCNIYLSIYLSIYRLGGFSLSLLLSLTRIRRFEESTIACVVGLVRGATQLRAR